MVLRFVFEPVPRVSGGGSIESRSRESRNEARGWSTGQAFAARGVRLVSPRLPGGETCSYARRQGKQALLFGPTVSPPRVHPACRRRRSTAGDTARRTPGPAPVPGSELGPRGGDGPRPTQSSRHPRDFLGDRRVFVLMWGLWRLLGGFRAGAGHQEDHAAVRSLGFQCLPRPLERGTGWGH